jgi:hypothetical protein
MEELSEKALKIAKKIANKVWSKYDDKFGYKSGKINRNNGFAEMLPVWQQFDPLNQGEFYMRAIKIKNKEILNWIKDWQKEALNVIKENSFQYGQ